MAKNKDSAPDKPQFYGRRKGHTLRPHRQQLMDELLPKLLVTSEGNNVPDATETWLEIGFGAGEHLAAQAETYPDIGFIGCEPYINGVATLLSVIERNSLTNIHIYNDDARDLLENLAPASISKVFVLFSDPWPKKRHNRRRFINPENLDALSRIMKDGAEFRFASDDMSFIRWGLDVFHKHPDFKWLVQGPEDWRNRYADAAPTRYEIKALKQGKNCVYLTYQRQARNT
jgi:tRNA (guanine-N7-)-methyltransferase